MTGDLFHRGHLELIKKAKALGDYLIVGLHPDDVVKKYKRAPVIKYEDRKAIIESIKEVDEVIEDCMDYRSPTMWENMFKYKPNLLVHGDDWLPPLYKKMKELIGIEIEQVPYYPYASTTKILQGIKSKNSLKEALKKKEKLVVVSANDAITTKLVEEFGFDGIWVSSFESSANLGLVDNETINLSDMINIVRPIVNSTDLPVIVDIDTGYGDIEQAVRAAKELEKVGVSAICIEDNLFPKSNSLWGGTKPLYDITKFGNKIKAIKESTNNLLVIARTEALIRNKGMEEAITRAEYYADCGSDMILIHSREPSGEEALLIPNLWNKKSPLIIIPSKFPQITNKELFNAGYSIVIYANQTMRAKIHGIKQALKVLKTEQNAKALDNYICSLDDFRNLTPIEETKKRQERYGK
jgi:phosphoenolpyruvate phosphomutase